MPAWCTDEEPLGPSLEVADSADSGTVHRVGDEDDRQPALALPPLPHPVSAEEQAGTPSPALEVRRSVRTRLHASACWAPSYGRISPPKGPQQLAPHEGEPTWLWDGPS